MILAQLATTDPNTIGVAVTSLVGCLGCAGAAVAVTYYFLAFLRHEAEKADRIFSEFRDYHAESQKKFQDQLERLADRQEQFQRGFQDQVSRMAETQNSLLRDCIMAMKAAEKTLDNSTATVHGMEKSIGAIQVSLNGIDVMIRRMAEVGCRPQPKPTGETADRKPPMPAEAEFNRRVKEEVDRNRRNAVGSVAPIDPRGIAR